MKTAEYSLALIMSLALAGCSTLDFKDAEPERFAAYDCDQLADLAESYRPDYTQQLFTDSDLTSFEHQIESGSSQRIGETTNRQRPYEAEQARDRRSIAAARRQKGCT